MQRAGGKKAANRQGAEQTIGRGDPASMEAVLFPSARVKSRRTESSSDLAVQQPSRDASH